jgi:two-component system sensor histidine kinase KdpD
MKWVVEKLVEEHRLRFPHRKIDVEIDAGSIAAEGQPTYIEQVLRNLMSNAEKYSPTDKPIKVRVRRRETNIEAFVLDRGPGFPEEEGERLFTPFYRSPRTSGTAAGVGIGLAVCRRLIDAQGGRIWAKPRPGGGAEMGFSLPAVDLSDADA